MRDLLAAGDAVASTVNIAETIDVACRVHGAPASSIYQAIELLLQTDLLAVAAPDLAAAERAAELRVAYYDRRARAISLADCFLLAAVGAGDSVATSDRAVAEVARAEGIALVPLPDSAGRRP